MRALALALLLQAVLAVPPWKSVDHRPAHGAPARPQRRQAPAESAPPAGLPTLEQLQTQAAAEGRRLCAVSPWADGGDDAPAIMAALNGACHSRGLVYLPGPVYNVASNMTTVDLDDVRLVQLGRLLWSPDIAYWRSVAMPVGFQNQTTVWYFGGRAVVWDGHGVGTLDGNGQVWYDWARGEGNLPQRPMNINFRGLRGAHVRRLRFVQSQMWTMAISDSAQVDLDDIYVNSTSSSRWNTLNTDGCDTINSDAITFRRWTVSNGDDAIALKGNSTNIAVYDSVFHDGQGIAIGSVGQYAGRTDTIRGFYARNITLHRTAHVSYLKTWSGVSRGFPPNGGGGGLGIAEDIVIEDVRVHRLRQQPFFAWQCEHYSGFMGRDCNSSRFKLRDVRWSRVSGTVDDGVRHVGWFQCSAAADGCDGFHVSDVAITKVDGQPLNAWHCENVHSNAGFTCSDAGAKL